MGGYFMIKKEHFIYTSIVLLFSLNILLFKEFLLAFQNKVYFLNVGQGDAFLIRLSSGHNILIDGGPSPKILKKLDTILPFWERRIDFLLLTHPDYDHLKGVVEMLKKNKFKIQVLAWTGVLKETKTFKEFLREKEKVQKEYFLYSGDLVLFPSKKCSFFLQILWPEREIKGRIFKKASNDTSIVGKLRGCQDSILFSGDITKAVEKKLVKKFPDKLGSQILKVAHHGSKMSSSNEFLKTVSPKIAIISVGKNNPYQHPHREVLERLKKYGILVLRTDLKGDIVLKIR